MKSAVMIVPDAGLVAANAFGEAMGWGPGNYSVPLSPTGAEPATHWGCRATVYQTFLDLLANPTEEALPIFAFTVMDLKDTDDFAGHFHQVIDGLGLAIIGG